ARAGQALQEQRERCRAAKVSFQSWCEQNLPFSYSTANRYLTIFRNWTRLHVIMSNMPEQDACLSIREALRLVGEGGSAWRTPPTKVQSAVRLINRLEPQELLQVADTLRDRLEDSTAQVLEQARQTLHETQALVAALQGI